MSSKLLIARNRATIVLSKIQQIRLAATPSKIVGVTEKRYGFVENEQSRSCAIRTTAKRTRV